jgi:hypothetical protein
LLAGLVTGSSVSVRNLTARERVPAFSRAASDGQRFFGADASVDAESRGRTHRRWCAGAADFSVVVSDGASSTRKAERHPGSLTTETFPRNPSTMVRTSVQTQSQPAVVPDGLLPAKRLEDALLDLGGDADSRDRARSDRTTRLRSRPAQLDRLAGAELDRVRTASWSPLVEAHAIPRPTAALYIQIQRRSERCRSIWWRATTSRTTSARSIRFEVQVQRAGLDAGQVEQLVTKSASRRWLRSMMSSDWLTASGGSGPPAGSAPPGASR